MTKLQKHALIQAMGDIKDARNKYSESRIATFRESKEASPKVSAPDGSITIAVQAETLMASALKWIDAVLDSADSSD